MQTSEVLHRAADLIEERGWVRATGWVVPSSPEGAPVCLEGAIQLASGITIDDGRSAIDMRTLRDCPAYRAVGEYLGFRIRNLFLWNDTRRDVSEVIEVLRACAVIEQSRERQPVEAVLR